MFTKLIEIKRRDMKNLLNEIQDLCRLQNYLESNTAVYMTRTFDGSPFNNVIAYLTGDYIALYDEFEFEVVRQTIDWYETSIVKLSQKDILEIYNNLLGYDDALSDGELLDEEFEEEE